MFLLKNHEAILIPHTPWASVDGLRDEHLTLPHSSVVIGGFHTYSHMWTHTGSCTRATHGDAACGDATGLRSPLLCCLHPGPEQSTCVWSEPSGAANVNTQQARGQGPDSEGLWNSLFMVLLLMSRMIILWTCIGLNKTWYLDVICWF